MGERGGTVRITAFAFSAKFKADYKKLARDVQKAADRSLRTLLDNPQAKALRLHPLQGMPKPMIWKIDVNGPGRHAWQITFELDGTIAHLKRIGRHKTIDRSPR